MFSYSPISTIALGPLTVHTWGLFVALGIVVTTFIAARRARRFGIAPPVIWNLAFWVTVAGLVGARVLYVAEYWRDFVSEPWRVVAIWEGGMSAFGSLLAAVPVSWWWARRRGLSVARLAETAAPSLLLGDAIGRLGGALSHMYPGVPTTFPISYVLDGVQRHEVGVELVLTSFLGFLVVLAIERRRQKMRRSHARLLHVSTLVLLWYSAERLLLDVLRASDLPNSDLRYAGFTLAQLCAMGGVAAASWLWWRGRPSRLGGPGVDR